MVVPAGGVAPMKASARVSVRKLQWLFATPPALPLPVPVPSFPFTGSTKYWLPVASSHWVQVLLAQMKVEPIPAQSLSPQQLPATHLLLQQKSAAFAAQACPLLLQVLVMQWPLSVPAAVLHRLAVVV